MLLCIALSTNALWLIVDFAFASSDAEGSEGMRESDERTQQRNAPLAQNK